MGINPKLEASDFTLLDSKNQNPIIEKTAPTDSDPFYLGVLFKVTLSDCSLKRWFCTC